jgi:hypothetical protein
MKPAPNMFRVSTGGVGRPKDGRSRSARIIKAPRGNERLPRGSEKLLVLTQAAAVDGCD